VDSRARRGLAVDEYLKLIALIGGGFPGCSARPALAPREFPGVIIGVLTSVVVTWLVQSYTDTSAFLHGFVAVASCMIVGYVAMLCCAKNAGAKNLAAHGVDRRNDATG